MWDDIKLTQEIIQIIYDNFMEIKNQTKIIQNGDYTWKLDFSEKGIFVRCWYLENKMKLLLHRENNKIMVVRVSITTARLD